jgi:general secretion pathway protein L
MSGVSNISEKALIVDVGYKNSAVFAVAAGQIHLVRAFPANLAAESGIESLCADIERTLLAFEETFNLNFRPDHVVITGPGLDGQSCEEGMATILGLPVKRTDLVRDSDLSIQNYPDDSWNPDRMNNAFALALIDMAGLKGLNFRKGPFAVKKRWLEHKKSLIKTGALAAVVLFFVCFNIFLDFYYTGKKLTLLDRQITEIFQTTFPDVKRIVDPLQQMRVKIKEVQKQSEFVIEAGKNIRAVDILNNISKVIPRETDVELNRLVIGLENVMVSGETDTFNAVDDIKGRLEQIKLFKIVTISSANMDGDRIKFKLKMEL